MAKVKAKVVAKAKRKPIKAGSTMPKNIGGAINAKLVATVNKNKNA
jgi:hypothetical protein